MITDKWSSLFPNISGLGDFIKMVCFEINNMQTGGTSSVLGLFDKIKVKDIDPTPIGNILIKNLNQVLYFRDSVDTAAIQIITSLIDEVTGTFDGRDVSADGAWLDTLYTTIGLSALTAAEVDQLENIGDVTVSYAQWGILGGLAATLTATELNYVDGVTSAIQTQLNLKAPLASPTFTGAVTIPSTADDGTYTGIVTNDSGVLKYRTKAEILSDIGAAAVAHLHDTQTLEHDAVNSNGGAFPFDTTGIVTHNQIVAAPDFTILGMSGSIISSTSAETSIEELDDSQVVEINTGFLEWTSGASAATYTITGSDEFQIDRSFDGYIRGKKYSWASGIKTGALTANACNWIYGKSDGTLDFTTTFAHATFEDNVVIFEVLYDGTNFEVVKENHVVEFQANVSLEIHDLINVLLDGTGADITRVLTGTGAAGGDREIKIVGADILHDHGLETTVPDSAGAGVTWNWYYTDGSGNWVRDALQTEAVMKYNNAGTPTALGTSPDKFGVWRMYVSKDDIESSAPNYFAVMSDAEYNTQNAAESAIVSGVPEATNELDELELAQLGYIVVKNNAAGGYIINILIEKKTLKSSTTGAGASNLASLISTNVTNFGGTLSGTDTSVQIALDTLDDHLHTGVYLPLAGGTMAGDLNMGTNKITALVAGTASTDAINKSQHDKALLSAKKVLDYMEYATDGAAQAAYVSSDIYGPNLKYWSKLEDAGDVTSPQIGNAGTEDGSPTYVACKFNNGIYVNANAEGYFFANNPAIITGATKGTIELWIKTDFNVVNGLPADATNHFFVAYTTAGNGIMYFYIHATNGIGIYRRDDASVVVSAFDTTSDWTAGDLVHLAFVWDKDAGFDATKTMAVDVNDVQTASTTTALGTFTDDTSNIYVGELNNQTFPADSVLDNLKIYSVTKTDFSDKDTEEPAMGGVQCYSENTIVEQGTYSLKVIAVQTDSLNDTLTRTLATNIDISDKETIQFKARALRTGTNFQMQIISGATTSTHDVNILIADTVQTETWDISAVTNDNKWEVASLVIKIIEASADNTIYLDDWIAY